MICFAVYAAATALVMYARSRSGKRDAKSRKVRRDLCDFTADKVISTSDPCVIVKGRFGKEQGLVIVRHALRMPQSALQDLNLTMTTSNAEYSYFNASQQFGDTTVEVVVPASDKLIQRYESFANMQIVRETPAMYANTTAKVIREKQRDGSMNWIYAILDGKAEQEDVMLNDSEFVLLPNPKWKRNEKNEFESIDDLLCLVLVTDRKLHSIRDLRSEHVSMLRRIRFKVAGELRERFGVVAERDLLLYFHYLPQFYHLHIHVSHRNRKHDRDVTRAHLLDDVLQNLERDGHHYSSVDLTYLQ